MREARRREGSEGVMMERTQGDKGKEKGRKRVREIGR